MGVVFFCCFLFVFVCPCSTYGGLFLKGRHSWASIHS